MAADSDIQIDDLTTAEVEGRGDFDELMRSVKGYLEEEYTKGRITGSNYSEVYLGSMTQVLQTATQFILAKGVTSQQVILLAEQIKTAEKQTLFIDAQIALINKQMEQITGDIALTAQRLATEVHNTATAAQVTINTISQDAQIKAQTAKLLKETALVDEAIFNAQAQRVDTVNNLPVAGVIGAQKKVHDAQADGFKRDAEQRLMKLMTDTNAVNFTFNPTYNAPASLEPDSINKVVEFAKAGLGIT